MPAALVECGFLTNPTEAQKLGTPSYRETVAQGVAQGILNYLALVRRAKGGAAAPVLQAPGAPVPGTTGAGVAGAVSAQGPTPVHNGPLPMASRDMGGKPGTAVPAGVRPGTVVGSSPGASAQPAGTTLSAPPPAVVAPAPVAPAPVAVPPAAPQAAPMVPAAQGIQPAAGPLPPMGKVPGRPPVAVAPPPRSMLNPALMQHQP